MSEELKLRVDRAEFADAASWVAQAISRNPNAAVVGGMRITADADGISLAGYNYETAHAAQLDAEVGVQGEALVSGRTLVQLAAALKGSDLELVLEGPRLNLTAGRSTYRIATMRAEDYPRLPTAAPKVGKISAVRLVQALGTVEHAVARDTILPTYTAVNLTGGSQLKMLATDRFRVARIVSPWSDRSTKDFEANVPATALMNSARGLSGEVTIGASEGMFSLTDATRSIVTRVLGDEARFPAIEPVFDFEPDLTVEVDTAAIVEALKRTLIVTEEHDLVIVEVGGGQITVRADSETADGVEEVEADMPAGPELTIKFNGSYLHQGFAAVATERLTVGFSENRARPALIHSVGDDSVAFAVMPRRS